MPLAETVAALGEQGWSEVGLVDVPVTHVVGTVSRPADFDRLLRPLHGYLRQRWQSVATANEPGGLPPVRLVQLGELYFVVDGHHRVSVARARGLPAVPALVRRVCTVAYACRCLTLLDLPTKVAERQLLEQYPVPDEVRPWLWLDEPAGWDRLRAAARTWLKSAAADQDGALDRATLVSRWWGAEVVPSARRCRGRNREPQEPGQILPDYLCALQVRDATGCCVA